MRLTGKALASVLAVMVSVLCSCNGSSPLAAMASAADLDPPEVQVGERLFLETRFAQFFLANSNGDVNARLRQGDPVVEHIQTIGKPLPGPFRGRSMNCRQCHLVDDLKHLSRYYVRTYCDFAARSPIPTRDGEPTATTPRNSPPLVNATLPRGVPEIFHFDGEFSTVEDLVAGTLTGRNFGWLPTEYDMAEAHVADVIRNDNGQNALAKKYGGRGVPYKTLFLGTDPAIPARLVIPQQYRIDVTMADDDEVLQAVARLIHAYLNSLRFSSDSTNEYNGSPYDVFLKKNNLPRTPKPGESDLAYAQRLLDLINSLSSPIFVTPADAPPSASNGKPEFQLQKGQRFAFGATELEGLKVFFAQPEIPGTLHSGNCVACHAPPNFTDYQFHNIGTSQIEYDDVFGSGSFAALAIPDLTTRNADFDQYLPASADHPSASSRFRAPVSEASPGYTDLGVWNIVGNPDIPNPQTTLLEILCGQFSVSGNACNADNLLPLTIAYFKTPTVRDLGQSAPYLHNGSLATIEDVISFYVTVGDLTRNGQLRNASPELLKVDMQADAPALSAFLRALNEDYD